MPFHRVDKSELFGTKKEYQGRAVLQSPDFVYLEFYELVDGQPKKAADQIIVCDGKSVYQFEGLPRRIWIYPLDNDPRKKAMSQGPLPFLFDMTVAKAKQRYMMQYLGEDATSHAIQIIPKLPMDREEFVQAWVLLDRETFLPTKIKLWSPDGKENKTFTFKPTATSKNPKINPAWFDGPLWVTKHTSQKNAGWKVFENARPEDALKESAAANPAPPARPVGARPAAKGAGVRQR